MADRIDFSITGDERIHCSGCKTRIRFALQRLPGVQHVTADIETQRVTVTFDPALLSPHQMQDRLKEMEFDTEVVS